MKAGSALVIEVISSEGWGVFYGGTPGQTYVKVSFMTFAKIQ